MSILAGLLISSALATSGATSAPLCPDEKELSPTEVGDAHGLTSVYWRPHWNQAPSKSTAILTRVIQPVLSSRASNDLPRMVIFELIIDRQGSIAVATALTPLPKSLVAPLSAAFQLWQFKPQKNAVTTNVSWCYGRTWQFPAN